MWGRGVLVLVLSIFLILSLGFVIADHEKDHVNDGAGGGFPPECAAVDCRQGFHCVAGGFCVPDSESDFNDDLFEELKREHGDAELDTDGGIGPGNFFYFLDKFFDGFSDDLSVREERVAEIRALLEEGRIDDAREVLEDYFNLIEELEREIAPEERDRARRSAAAILKAFNALGSQASPEIKEEFIDRIFERESGLITSVEISSKIKELCEALSELDPLEYSRVCRTDEGDAKWHRDLDRDLTDEQKKEAEAFFEIMSQCFETSGETCRCEDISFTEFSETCAIVAPLEATLSSLTDKSSLNPSKNLSRK